MKIISAFVIIQISFGIFPEQGTIPDEDNETSTQGYSRKSKDKKVHSDKFLKAIKNYKRNRISNLRKRVQRYESFQKPKSMEHQDMDDKSQDTSHASNKLTYEEMKYNPNQELNAGQRYSLWGEQPDITFRKKFRTRTIYDGVQYNVPPSQVFMKKYESLKRLNITILTAWLKSTNDQPIDVKSLAEAYVKRKLTDEEVNFIPNPEFSETLIEIYKNECDKYHNIFSSRDIESFIPENETDDDSEFRMMVRCTIIKMIYWFYARKQEGMVQFEPNEPNQVIIYFQKICLKLEVTNGYWRTKCLDYIKDLLRIHLNHIFPEWPKRT